MRRLVVMVGVLFGLSGRASADYGSEWRDGCPAGKVEQSPDVGYADPGAAPSYQGTEPRLVGPAPQLDSALVPSRMLLAGPYYIHFASDNAAARARLLGGLMQVHRNFGEQGDIASEAHIFGFTLTLPALGVLPGDVTSSGQPTPTPLEIGNLVFAGSFQGYWLTSIFASRADGAPADIAGLRNAVAIQVTAAFRPWPYDVNDATTLLQRTAFDSALFAPHPTLGLAFELRSEGVGCYAPFVHLRLSAFGDQDGPRQHLSIFAPQTLAVGVAASSNTSVMVQYGLLISSYSGPSTQAVLPSGVVHRLRFGLDYTSGDGWSTGGAFDVFMGNPLYDGTAFYLYLSWNFGFGAPTSGLATHKDPYP